jgi:hypothetical protein
VPGLLSQDHIIGLATCQEYRELELLLEQEALPA